MDWIDWRLGGGGLDKVKAPIFHLVRLRRPIAENGDGAFDVVPIDVPLVGLEPMGSCFDVSDGDGGA